ncbi:hypothetical protein FB107DRAFT_253757 [Schizophyllum commune]
MSAPSDVVPHSQKKPRNRHSPSQVAALKEVYDKNDHPPLEDRTQLAQKLGMQIKTVNAWFQNRRASSRKRTQRAEAHTDPSRSISGSPPPLDEDDQHHMSQDHSHSSQLHSTSDQATSHTAKSDMTRKPQRNRPTPEQLDELRKLFETTQHPSTEQRTQLAERIGMKYQTITNWFQNQRSVYKNKRAPGNPNLLWGSSSLSTIAPAVSAPAQPLPPPSTHPSLGLSGPPLLSSISAHPRLPSLPISRGASLEPHHLAHGSKPEDNLSDRGSMRAFSDDGHLRDRSDTPLSTAQHSVSSFDRLRPSTPPISTFHGQSPSFGPQRNLTPSPARVKRANSSPRHAKPTSSYPRNRPEPSQLDALRKLFAVTQTPSVEQRTRLADDIGMDLAKVTNWFRNSRQTSRRRQAKGLPDPPPPLSEGKDESVAGSAKPGQSVADDDEVMDGSVDDDVEMDDSNSSRGTPMSTEDESDMEQDVHLPPLDITSRRLPPPLGMTGPRDADGPMIISPTPIAHLRSRAFGLGLDVPEHGRQMMVDYKAQAASGLPMSPVPILPLPTPSMHVAAPPTSRGLYTPPPLKHVTPPAHGQPMLPSIRLTPPLRQTPPPYPSQAAYAHDRPFDLPLPKADRMSIDQSWASDVSMKDARSSISSSASVRVEDAMLLLDFSTRSVELVAH